MAKHIIWTGLLLLLGGCAEISGNISSTPAIELVQVKPEMPVEYKDSIVFTLFYRDGDGDLGENDPDAENLFITDLRNEVTTGYRIPALAPGNDPVAIQGTLSVALENTFRISGADNETVTYEIQIIDRSGNKSNKLISPELKILKLDR